MNAMAICTVFLILYNPLSYGAFCDADMMKSGTLVNSYRETGPNKKIACQRAMKECQRKEPFYNGVCISKPSEGKVDPDRGDESYPDFIQKKIRWRSNPSVKACRALLKTNTGDSIKGFRSIAVGPNSQIGKRRACLKAIKKCRQQKKEEQSCWITD